MCLGCPINGVTRRIQIQWLVVPMVWTMCTETALKKILLSSLRVELVKLSTPSGSRTQQMHEKQHAWLNQNIYWLLKQSFIGLSTDGSVGDSFRRRCLLALSPLPDNWECFSFFLKICELLLIMPRVAKVCYEHHICSLSYFWVYRSCVMVAWHDLPSFIFFEDVF